MFVQLILNSMQKYQPCLKITRVSTGGTQSYCFIETTFIAVTAYQNKEVSLVSFGAMPLCSDHNHY